MIDLQSLQLAGVIACSLAMRKILSLMKRVAGTDSTVLIRGETGSGKGVLAKAVHLASRRASRPFVPIHCGGFPDQLLEAELFGHVKGAFTNAAQDRVGRFEEANGGTVFLDEIGEMSLPAQVKLLRILDDKCVERLGSNKQHQLDIRLVCATNRDLGAAAGAGAFRSDLYYRLRVVEIVIPPLRERPEDVPLLASHFLHLCNASCGCNMEGITPAAMDRLLHYAWPGNVRELKHVIESACVCSIGRLIGVGDLALPEAGAQGLRPNVERRQGERRRQPGSAKPVPRSGKTPEEDALSSSDYSVLLNLLNQHQWHITNTAAALGVHRTTLWRRMQRIGITS